MRRFPVVILSVLAATVLVTAVAMATPSKGTSRTEYGRGVHPKTGVIQVTEGKESVTYSITLEPGGSTGWHTHPGSAVFIVTAGTLSNYGLDGEACTAQTITAGEAYVAPVHAHHPHLARNEGTDPVEAMVIAFDVPPGRQSRIDAEPPAECKDLS